MIKGLPSKRDPVKCRLVRIPCLDGCLVLRTYSYKCVQLAAVLSLAIFICTDYLTVSKAIGKDVNREDAISIINGTTFLDKLLENKYKMTIATDSKLSIRDRNIIIVVEEELNKYHNYSILIRQFLMFHPEVICLGSLTPLVNKWYVDDSDGYIDSFIGKLYECHYDVLSEFVHYSNEILRRLGRPLWCGSNNQLSVMSLNRVFSSAGFDRPKRTDRAYHRCDPPPKKQFHRLCSSHHLALYFSDKEYSLVLKGLTRRRNMKVLKLSQSSHEEPCRVAPKQNAAHSNRDGYDDDYFEMAFSSLSNAKIFSYCMQELSNYFDIFFIPSFINNYFMTT